MRTIRRKTRTIALTSQSATSTMPSKLPAIRTRSAPVRSNWPSSQIDANAPTEPVRELAREMAREEAEHVRWVTSALEYVPSKAIDWEKILARARGPGPGVFLGFAGAAPPAKRRRRTPGH